MCDVKLVCGCNSANKNFNAGVGLLKFLMAQIVVCIHFGGYIPGQALAVYIFMFYSFFYFDETISLYAKIKRIILPFWFWGIVATLFSFFLKDNFSLKNFILQLTFGHTYCSPLWFCFSLLCLTTIFYIIKCVIHIKIYSYIIILGASIFWVQSGLNYALLSHVSEAIAVPVGRTTEIMPVAIFGILVGGGGGQS